MPTVQPPKTTFPAHKNNVPWCGVWRPRRIGLPTPEAARVGSASPKSEKIDQKSGRCRWVGQRNCLAAQAPRIQFFAAWGVYTGFWVCFILIGGRAGGISRSDATSSHFRPKIMLPSHAATSWAMILLVVSCGTRASSRSIANFSPPLTRLSTLRLQGKPTQQEDVRAFRNPRLFLAHIAFPYRLAPPGVGPHQKTNESSDAVIRMPKRSPQRRFFVGCSSSFMRLVQHLTVLHA